MTARKHKELEKLRCKFRITSKMAAEGISTSEEIQGKNVAEVNFIKNMNKTTLLVDDD